MKFTHRIYNFNPIGVLAQVGITPATHGLLYQQLLPEVEAIIETQVRTSAATLNSQLKEVYRKDMFDIYEYLMFPRYIQVMELALSNPLHIGAYWDNKGVIQARFVDTGALGDIGDLQRIQRMVSPAGTLRGWIGIYNAWLAGRGSKYENIVSQRLDIMSSERIAPFWQLIEDGNGPAAYPQNPPKRTLANFKPNYTREMRVAFTRCIAAARALAAAPSRIFINYQASTVVFGNRTYFGHAWTSLTGKTIFAISGTTVVDRLGRLAGRGFILDSTGSVVKAWSGWLPR